MTIRFEWDESKRRLNLKKHGIDYVDVPDVFAGDILTIEDVRYDYGETRYITIGQVKGITIVVAHSETDDTIRIISARKATRYEEIRYFEEIAD